MNTIKLLPEQYPPLLQTLEKMPPFLYCAGELPPSSEYTYLCVVGSRRYSEYGRDACIKLISGLRNYPVVIVSGLAIGIDSVAHAAALNVGLKTLSFPGSGLSRGALYPAAHYQLAMKIIESGGTLLSPFDPEQMGAVWTFPVRNELMAASSKATLVIEGGNGSGTLITADAGLRFNRDVMVVPGSIFASHSYAPHYLFGQGATPVFTSEDILGVLGFDVNRPKPAPDEPLQIESLPLSPDQKNIIRELQHGALNSSDLIKKTSLSAIQLNMLLSQLELEEIIIEHGGVFRINGL